MIYSKIYLEDSNSDNPKIIFEINKNINQYNCKPAGKTFHPIIGEGFREFSTVIGFDAIAISEEAKKALYLNLTNNNRGRYDRSGKVGIYSLDVDIPGQEKQQICIEWTPDDPSKSPNLALDANGQFSIDISRGFAPQLLTKINNVLENEYLQNANFEILNMGQPTM